MFLPSADTTGHRVYSWWTDQSQCWLQLQETRWVLTYWVGISFSLTHTHNLTLQCSTNNKNDPSRQSTCLCFVPFRIYECNKQCRCNPQMCTNRLVQHGLQVRLQLFKTQNKGWGIRCLDDVAKGSFVCIYAGTEQAALDPRCLFLYFVVRHEQWAQRLRFRDQFPERSCVWVVLWFTSPSTFYSSLWSHIVCWNA